MVLMTDLYICARFDPDGSEGFPENSNLRRLMRTVVMIENTDLYHNCFTIGKRRTTAFLKATEIVKLKRKEL